MEFLQPLFDFFNSTTDGGKFIVFVIIVGIIFTACFIPYWLFEWFKRIRINLPTISKSNTSINYPTLILLLPDGVKKLKTQTFTIPRKDELVNYKEEEYQVMKVTHDIKRNEIIIDLS